MKKLMILTAVLGYVFSGCKEIGPPINLSSSGGVSLGDTVYTVTPVPAMQPHNMLIEDFTGQSCTNCPPAHGLLEGYQATYPGRINVTCLYIYNFPQADPLNTSRYDFRDSAATTIGNIIYGGINQEPVAGIDRDPLDSALVGPTVLLTSSGQWSSLIPAQLNVFDSVNLTVSSSYNSTTDSAVITLTVTYTQTVTSAQNISVAIVEDSMVDIQDDFPTVDTNYVFTDVLREYVTYVPSGDPILATMATKVPGTTLVRKYKAGLKSSWVPAHCRIIAYVNSAIAPYSVWQSAECAFAP